MLSTDKIFRIMHMSDLHLGKSLRARDLSEDQAHALGQIVAAARSLRPDLVLVAGDVFDRSIPSEVAQTMFGRFMADLRRALPEEAKILVIPGNHDSPRRVAFAAELFEAVGIHLVSEVKREPALILERGGARLAVWALPFVTHGLYYDFKRKTAGAEPQPELEPQPGANDGSMASRLAELIETFRPRFGEFDLNIIAAHCYVRGAEISESNADFLGGSEAVPASLFEDFDYAALGHLHRQQRLTPSLWYAGAPMAMSFGDGESQKGLLRVELEPRLEAPRVEPVALAPLHRFRRVRGTFAELSSGADEGDSDYIEAVLTDEYIVFNARNDLLRRFPNLMGVKQEAFERLAHGFDLSGHRAAGPDKTGAPSRGEEPSESGEASLRDIVLEDFRAFSSFILNSEAPEELARRFESLLSAVEGEHQ